jgi:hypothetical protein
MIHVTHLTPGSGVNNHYVLVKSGSFHGEEGGGIGTSNEVSGHHRGGSGGGGAGPSNLGGGGGARWLTPPAPHLKGAWYPVVPRWLTQPLHLSSEKPVSKCAFQNATCAATRRGRERRRWVRRGGRRGGRRFKSWCGRRRRSERVEARARVVTRAERRAGHGGAVQVESS